MMPNIASSLLFSAVIAISVACTSSFTVIVPQQHQRILSASTTALFDSRKKQKIASRTVWLEKRMGSDATADATDAAVDEENEDTAVVDDSADEVLVDTDVTVEDPESADVAATPEVAADVTPEVAADVTPEVAADVTPEVAADDTPEVAADVTPEVAADVTPGLLKNEQGLEYVQLIHPESGAKSQIYVYGGVVTSYQDKDGTEFIAVRPDAMLDGSKPISGGLSHCWPQFGPGAIQQHGFARNVAWTVGSMTDTSVSMTLEPNEYTKAIWDQPFKCTFTVALQADQLDTKMTVENTGTEAWSFQAALHSYFTVSALDNLEIAGSWKGKEFLNKLVGEDGETQTEERDVITITEEYDRVYTGVNDPVLNDKGTQKSLSVLNAAGWEDTVLWNPYGNEKMGYNNFVCVESVKFNPVELAGGANWVGDMSLKPASL